jgi:retron-type reverse transcriptase
LILNSYDIKKLAVRKVTQLNYGKKAAGVDGISKLNEKQRVWLVIILKSLVRRGLFKESRFKNLRVVIGHWVNV